jgi:hypothetical protein
MIIKSFSIPSPACIHSSVDLMTPEEIRLMNELLAKRRAWFIDLIRSIDPDTVTDIPTPGVTDEQAMDNSDAG